jgi:hypothetical protein
MATHADDAEPPAGLALDNSVETIYRVVYGHLIATGLPRNEWWSVFDTFLRHFRGQHGARTSGSTQSFERTPWSKVMTALKNYRRGYRLPVRNSVLSFPFFLEHQLRIPHPIPLPRDPVAPSITAHAANKRKERARASSSSASYSSVSSASTPPLISASSAVVPSFPPSQLSSPTLAPLLQSVLPGMQVRKVPADNLCWLHTISVIADPTDELNAARLIAVRSALVDELRRWGEDKWIDRVPGYSLRNQLYSKRQWEEKTSFDVFLRLLSSPAHHREWRCHSVFYLASSAYDIDFFVVGVFPQSDDKLYHRRIEETPTPRIKAAVWHSGNHYEPMAIASSDADTVFQAIAALREQTSCSSSWEDPDKRIVEERRKRKLMEEAIELIDSPAKQQKQTKRPHIIP